MEDNKQLTTQTTTTLPSMWNDKEILAQAYSAAKYLASTDLVPAMYKKPENCLIALEFANRTGLSPLTVMQNLYVVNGKPSWSGQMCIALINGCKRFTPLEFEFDGKPGEDNYGCFAYATRLDNGKTYYSDKITIGMAKKEGWYSKIDKYGKETSKWQTMPTQMAMYRAGAFFARVHCPDILLGLPTTEELYDVESAKETAKQAINDSLNEVLNEDIN